MAWATSRSTMTGPQEARSASCSSTQSGAGLREAVGLAGDPAGLPGRHLEPADAFPEEGEAVAQVEGVGDQLCPGRRGDAEREGERFGGERGDRRGAVAAERLVGQQGRPAGGLDAGVGGGGVQDGPVGGELELAERGSSFGSVRPRRRLRARRRGRGRRPRTAPGPWCSWVKPSIDHRQSRPQNPCIHRGISAS